MVSKALLKANQYGGNEMEYQIGKKTKEHKMDMEYALFGLGRDSDVKNQFSKIMFKHKKQQVEKWLDFFIISLKEKDSFC